MHNIKHNSKLQIDRDLHTNIQKLKDCDSYNAISNIMTKIHILLGHPGPKAFLKTIKNNVSSSLDLTNNQIISFCINCLECQKNKHYNIKYGFTVGIVHSNRPQELISSDICGPYNLIKNKIISKIFVITMTDLCTRYPICKIVRNTESKTLISAFKTTWFKGFNPPKKLVADRGPQYTSNSFKTFMNSRGVNISFCTPNNATGNAKSERINRQINEIFQIFIWKN